MRKGQWLNQSAGSTPAMRSNLKTIIMTKLEKLRKKVKLQNTWNEKRITFGTTDRIKSATKPSYSRNALWTYHGNKKYFSHSKWEGLREA